MQRDKSIIQEAHSTGCAENYAILHRQMMNVFKFFHGLDVYNVFIFSPTFLHLRFGLLIRPLRSYTEQTNRVEGKRY